VPVTFHVSNKSDKEYQKYIDYNDKLRQKHQKDSIWIIKPGENTNRGKGIQVCQNIKEIEDFMDNNSDNHRNGDLKSFII